MAIKHFEHPCTVHFMGSHPGTFNIDRDDEAMTPARMSRTRTAVSTTMPS